MNSVQITKWIVAALEDYSRYPFEEVAKEMNYLQYWRKLMKMVKAENLLWTEVRICVASAMDKTRKMLLDTYDFGYIHLYRDLCEIEVALKGINQPYYVQLLRLIDSVVASIEERDYGNLAHSFWETRELSYDAILGIVTMVSKSRNKPQLLGLLEFLDYVQNYSQSDFWTETVQTALRNLRAGLAK